jgi:hypothetical protein
MLAQDIRARTLAEIQNNLDEPIAVFLQYGRFDQRLGTVAARSTTTLALPEAPVGGRAQVQLVAVRSTGQKLESRWFEARPGRMIQMMVPSPPEAAGKIYMELAPENLFKTTLTVINERPTEVVVYAGEDPFGVRLGTVPAHATATLEFPRSVVRPDRSIRVAVNPKNGFALESYPLQLRMEEHLALRLAADQ